jgi:AcrR family transcriptional regulator
MTALGASAAPDPRREAILRHARRDFTSEGFAATRMEPIAREAGVSTATLYSYFASKDLLFAAVIEDASDDFAQQMDAVLAQDGPARQRLASFIAAYAVFMSDPFVRSMFRLVMAERPRFESVAMRFFERGRSLFGAALIASIVDLTRRGELICDKPSWAAGQLMGMVEHPVFFVPLVTGDEVKARRPINQIADDAVETFLRRYGVSQG